MVAFTLLNTRPKDQAKALNKLVKQQGGEAISLPTIDVQWLKPPVQQNLNVARVDKIIFISVNAVKGWQYWLNQQAKPTLQAFECADYYAIGKATQTQGVQLGLAFKVLSDNQFDSEHFLAHTEMQNVQGQSIVLVKGVGGRTLIEETLKKRGANVQTQEVYERTAVPFNEQKWHNFLEAPSPILLMTSKQSWHNFLLAMCQLYVSDTHHLHNKQSLSSQQIDTVIKHAFWSHIQAVVVMSERIANALVEDGCQANIVVVKTQSNQGIVDSVVESLPT